MAEQMNYLKSTGRRKFDWLYYLDIDEFKFVNDIYGHVCGDNALKSLADSMKAFFPSGALLGRNGGDEFVILLKDYSYDDVKEKLQQFTMAPKTFSYKGKEHQILYFSWICGISDICV